MKPSIKIQKTFSGNTAPKTSSWNKTKQNNKIPHLVKIEPNKIESKQRTKERRSSW